MAKVIIIGGGVAGLCAGIYCRKAGFSCEIFEKHSAAGGNLTGWHRKGATIDNCIHWLTGTKDGNELHEIWMETEMLTPDTKLFWAEQFYESRLGNQSLALFRDLEKTKREMLRLSPEDKKEIDRFIDTVRALLPIIGGGNWKEKTGALVKIPNVMYYWKNDLYSVAKRFRHPLLQYLFTDYIGGEFSAMGLLCAYAAFVSGNGSVPMGGSIEAAKRMAKRFCDMGGVLHVSKPVSKIAIRGKRAEGILTEDGEFYPAEHIVCATDPTVTFGKLLPNSWMPYRMKMRLENPKTPIFSSVHAAFLCDRADFRPFHTCIIPSPHFSLRSGSRLPVKEFSHELTAAPAGKVLLQTLVFQLEEECKEWIALAKDKDAYEKKKAELGEEMKAAIAKEFPLLADSLECIDVWTPATYHRYFDSNCGAYLSNALTPSASLLPLSNRLEEPENVYLATQWLRSPGGLPLAALSGVAAAKDILYEEHQELKRTAGKR